VRRAALAALCYFVGVFALGFVAGTVRQLLLVPQMGEAVAVFLELPVMLGASWLLSRTLSEHFRLGRAAGPRLLMGGLAFLLLMAAEFALGILLMGMPPDRLVGQWATLAGAAGLGGQLLFALFPFLQRRF
jgi:hypothetical protein